MCCCVCVFLFFFYNNFPFCGWLHKKPVHVIIWFDMINTLDICLAQDLSGFLLSLPSHCVRNYFFTWLLLRVYEKKSFCNCLSKGVIGHLQVDEAQLWTFALSQKNNPFILFYFFNWKEEVQTPSMSSEMDCIFQ